MEGSGAARKLQPLHGFGSLVGVGGFCFFKFLHNKHNTTSRAQTKKHTRIFLLLLKVNHEHELQSPFPHPQKIVFFFPSYFEGKPSTE